MPKDDKKSKTPETWYLYDYRGTCLGNVALDATGNFSTQISKDDNNPYYDEMVLIANQFGSDDGMEMKHSVIIPNTDRDYVIEAYNNAGFMAVKASKRDHDELVRELDKIQTVKGGESKKYK